MNVYREKPDFGKTSSRISPSKSNDDPMSCIRIPVGIVIAYFFTSAIVHSMYGSATELEEFVCYITLICLVIIMLIGAKDWYKESEARNAERRSWAGGCKSAQLTIVGRHEAISWWDDYSNRYRSYPCTLELEMNSDQRTASPNRTIVSVRVDDYIYKRLKDCNGVRIYYMPESPLTFLLENEL